MECVKSFGWNILQDSMLHFFTVKYVIICIMLLEKTNISARVEITLKKIVEESSFTHKDAYELGAMLIAIGDAQETITLIHNNPNYERIMKQREYKLIEERKQELERELRDL